MTRYAAFLRGVNLGKRTVKSAELRAAFEELGFSDVKTLLASGNVLFDAKPTKTLKDKIEAGLEAQFGFEVEAFHQAKIVRLIVVLRHLEVDEGIAAFELQARIVRAFVAQGRELAFRHSRAADRPRTVRRIEDDLIAKFEDLLQGIVEKTCDLVLAIGIEIRAPDVADE